MKKVRSFLGIISTMLNIITSLIVIKKLREGNFIVQTDDKTD